jgi:hypothetical protein
MCKTKQIHKGGWPLESCSNNDLKPPLPNSVGTKEMLPPLLYSKDLCVKEESIEIKK